MTDRKKYGDTVKIFISQPMTGKSPEEIRKTRENIIKHAGMKYGGDIIILDSWFGEEFRKKSPLYLLGKSLELLAEADGNSRADAESNIPVVRNTVFRWNMRNKKILQI